MAYNPPCGRPLARGRMDVYFLNMIHKLLQEVTAMNRCDPAHWGTALRQLGPLTILGCFFLLGGILGSLLASLIAGQGAQSLEKFLLDYLAAAEAGEFTVRFWPMAWEQGRFFLGICLFGVTALGAVGIPTLFLIRGFLFSFSAAAFCRIFGPAGLASAFFLFGLPAFLWAPVLFLAGTQSFEGAYALLRRVLGDSRSSQPQGTGYWGRLAAYGLCLILCVVLECMAARVLLRAAAQVVL